MNSEERNRLREAYDLMRVALSDIVIQMGAIVSPSNEPDKVRELMELIAQSSVVVQRCRNLVGDKRFYEDVKHAQAERGVQPEPERNQFKADAPPLCHKCMTLHHDTEPCKERDADIREGIKADLETDQ